MTPEWTPGEDSAGPGESATDTVEDVANSAALDLAARFGFAVTGLVHILIGAIALGIAFGGKGEADPSGAVQLLADVPAGSWLLWGGFAGCAALSLWQLGEATVRARHLQPRPRVAKGFSSGWLAVTYGALAFMLARFALGQRSASRRSSRDVTTVILGWPGGVLLLIAVGLAVIGVGVYFVVKAVTRRFQQELHFPHSKRGKALTVLGIVGHLAKGLALMLVGLLVVIASVKHRPEESTGLDGSLKALTDQPYGEYVLSAIALGLICYGVFAVIRARYGRM
ncbi:MAG TPA: DUF1206 domain-containing protein [Micrococcaceae bacterium]|jgi:uncharacterized membrane protein YidH (DUF202 family)|nr:DUF1206 domain-containing protein [Micrococcaceae bacterium]